MSEKDEQDGARVIAFPPPTRSPATPRYTRLPRPGARGAGNGCTTDHDCPPDKLCERGHCV
ncbi:hypothetical protein GCM10027062_26330 [Nocardioides hungaricus]